MTYAIGTTLSVPEPRHERFLLDGKLCQSRNNRAWWVGMALDWRMNCYFRVLSSAWFPVGSVLICSSAIDIDCFAVDTERTIAENGMSLEWLRKNQPGGGDGQLNLDLWK